MEQVDEYFKAYENIEIHEILLRDRPRQEAYKNAIMKNSLLFRNKIVLDVGAGTGILSAFCAKAGAKVVYAVEATNLANIALKVMEDNSLTNIVEVIQSKIEDFQLPSAFEKVDIIVSEWMGFYLLHEGMLDSVLYARDKFLKSDGLMFPCEAKIYIAPCIVPFRFDDWEEVDGIRLNAFGSMIRLQKSSRPEIVEVSPNHLLHNGVVLHWLNLMDVDRNELEIISCQEVISVNKSGKLQGFCVWFDCKFPGESLDHTVVLCTGPQSPPTHWKQCVVVLPENVCEDVEENAPISFKITMKRREDDFRKYDIEVEILDPNEIEHPVPCDCYLTKCILLKAHLQAIHKS